MQELSPLWEELVNAWLINNRVNLLMVNDLTKEALDSTLLTLKQAKVRRPESLKMGLWTWNKS